jgi:hypothetical protein
MLYFRLRDCEGVSQWDKIAMKWNRAGCEFLARPGPPTFRSGPVRFVWWTLRLGRAARPVAGRLARAGFSPDVLLQAGWSKIVIALVNQKTQLELDALPDLYHVKFITEDRSDMVILAYWRTVVTRRAEALMTDWIRSSCSRFNIIKLHQSSLR